MDLRKTGDGDRREDRENMFYPFFYNEKKGELLVGNPANLEEEKDGYVKILPLRGDGTYGRWRWGAETSQKLVDKLFAKLMPARQVWSVFEFDYLEDKEGVKPTSAWTHKDVNSERGSEQFIKLGFDKEVFPRPKPVGTIKRILQIATTTNADDIVLDFFSGSGTTAQAVIEQNGEDGGKRKFILIQLPEAIDSKQKAFEFGFSTISQITIERNKRVIEGYGDDPQPLDTGFKVYRLTKSYFPRAEFQPDPDKSNEENVALLKQYIAEKEASFHMAFEQDQVFDEVLLKHGFKLDYKLTEQEEFSKNAVYLVEESDRKAYICLDTNIAEETIDFFKTHTGTMFICLERALDTTKKWNLNHTLGERLKAL
jgi:adenine-specific DNA-methyltransferase